MGQKEGTVIDNFKFCVYVKLVEHLDKGLMHMLSYSVTMVLNGSN